MSLQDVLTQAQAVNTNYDPELLAESVRADIEEALSPRRIVDRDKRIEDLAAGIRARVAQIKPDDHKNELWGNRTRGALEINFARSPRTILKAMQEALTHPADRVDIQKNAIARIASETALLADIVIDPDRLSTTFLAHLGLQADSLHEKIKCIPDVKKVLASLEPIKLGASTPPISYRLFRIGAGPKTGYVLGVQEIAGEERIFVTTLHEAKRRVDHIEEQYREEQAQLARIHQKLDEIDNLLANEWESVKRPNQLRALVLTLHGLIEELRFVRNDEKKLLHEMLEKALEQLQRKNPAAARASMYRVKRHRLIHGRMQEIPRIFSYLAADKRALDSVIAKEEYALEALYTKVQAQLEAKETPRLTDPSTPLTNEEMQALRAKLERMKTELMDRVRFQPSLGFAERIERYLYLTIEELSEESPNREQAARAFLRAFLVSKLAKFHHFLLALYEVFSVHGLYGVHVADWKRELEKAETELHARTLAQGIVINEFDYLCGREIADFVDGLRMQMDVFRKSKSSAVREQTIADIKTLISSFDLPGKLQAIPHLA